jgi:hypothetical protein
MKERKRKKRRIKVEKNLIIKQEVEKKAKRK